MTCEKAYFSLIICTYRRRKELERLLLSIEKQTCKSYEIILIDQNEDDLISAVLEKFRGLNIACKKMHHQGLSAARNYAAGLASGEVCAFPDDDCWYPENVLQEVYTRMQSSAADGLSLGVAAPDQRYSAGGIMSGASWKKINKYNAWTCANSSGIFLKREVLLKNGGFRKDLGIGANGPFQSGEDTEIILRLLKEHCRLYYTAQITIIHPPVMWITDWQRAFSYGCGGGFVSAQYHYPFWFILLAFGYKMLCSVLAVCRINFQEARFHFFMGLGKLITFIRHYQYPQRLIFWLALLLSGFVASITTIPADDTVMRYAPMAEAFARGDWVYAFHPRAGVYFSSLAGLVSFLTGCNGITACQAVGCFLFAIAVLPLFRLFEIIWSERIAIIGTLLYTFCSHLLRYSADGLRDNGKTLAFALLALGLVGLARQKEKRFFAFCLAGGMALLTVLRGEGALLAGLFGILGACLAADFKLILKGGILFLLLILPQLIYNTWAIGYPVPETRHAYFLKNLQIPPLYSKHAFREHLK